MDGTPALVLNDGMSVVGLSIAFAPYPKDRYSNDPRKKTPEWIEQYGRAIVTANSSRPGGGPFWQSRDRYYNLNLFAEGGQGSARYIALDNPDALGISAEIADMIRTKPEQLPEPLPLIKKYLEAAVENLDRSKYEVEVLPSDSVAVEENRKLLAAVKMWRDNGTFLQTLGMQPPVDPLPQNEQEEQVMVLLRQRCADTIALKGKIKKVFTDAAIEQEVQRAERQLARYGATVLYIPQARSGALLPKPRALPSPGDAFISAGNDPYYKDLREGAHVEYLPLDVLKMEAAAEGRKFLDWEWANIEAVARHNPADAGAEQPMNMSVYNWPGGFTDTRLVRVVRFAFLSGNEEVYVSYENQYGSPQTRKKQAGYKGDGTKKVQRCIINDLYEGTLIVGTNLAYGCRQSYEQVRDPDDPKKCLFPYQAVAIPGLSLLERMMRVDALAQTGWLNLWNAYRRYIPPTPSFDIAQLQDIILTGTKASKITDLIALRLAGKIAVRNSGAVDPGSTVAGDAYGILPGSGVAEIESFWGQIQNAVNLMEQLTGLTGAAVAAPLNPEVGKGVTAMALEGSQRLLASLAFARRALVEQTGKVVGVRVQMLEADAHGNPRQPVTGAVSGPLGPQYLDVRPSIRLRTFAFSVRLMPTEEEKAEFRASLQAALDRQSITAADRALISQIDDMMLAWLVLSVAEARRQRQVAKEAQDAAAANAQQQGEAAKVAAQAEQETAQVKSQLEMQLEQLKQQGAQQLADIKGRYAVQVAQITAGVRLDAAHVAADASRDVADVRHEADTRRLGAEMADADAARQHEAAESAKTEKREKATAGKQ